MPNETIKRVCARFSLENQPIRTLRGPSEHEKGNKTIGRSVKTLHSFKKADSNENEINCVNSSVPFLKTKRLIKMFDDNYSVNSNASIQAQKKDLEIQISNVQNQLLFLKREGQYRINSADGRILKYRPDKRTRGQIYELEKELLTLNQARTSLDILPEEQEPEPRVSKRLKIIVRDVVAKQRGMGHAADETMAEKLKHVLALTEKTDITVEKWIKETNEDAELSILRQAILDGKESNIPLNYKLFKDELTVELGLVFVANKLAVPKSLREWVIQVAHGDHWSTDKMAAFTELVYWPGKLRDLKEKSKSCLICFQAGKNFAL